MCSIATHDFHYRRFDYFADSRTRVRRYDTGLGVEIAHAAFHNETWFAGAFPVFRVGGVMSDSSLGDRHIMSDVDPSPKPRGLSKEVHTLTSVIKQLEEQLDQMMATNETLRKDQQDELARRMTLETRVEELQEMLRRSERQAAEKDNLIGEVKHVNQERARLAASMRELGDRLKELTEQHDGDAKKIERLRAAHADALEEVQSVEAQFERAIQVVAQTRAQLSIALEERDQHSARARNGEALLAELRHERDSLVTEVEQSRAALDEIRQSLIDEGLSGGRGEPAAAARAAPAPAEKQQRQR
jgi:uncharacterized coiled-coil DUF342 family protein